MAGGSLGVVAAWLREGHDVPAEEIAERLRRVLPTWLTTDVPADTVSPALRKEQHGKA